MFIVWQFAMLNFPSIMQPLKKFSLNVKHIILFVTNRQKYSILLHISLQTYQENIYYFEKHTKSSTNSFSVPFSIPFSSTIRLIVIPMGLLISFPKTYYYQLSLLSVIIHVAKIHNLEMANKNVQIVVFCMPLHIYIHYNHTRAQGQK